MWLEHRSIFVGNGPRGLAGTGPECTALQILDIEPQSIGIARRVRHEAGDGLSLPAQRAAATFGDPARQSAIAQYLHLREMCVCRLPWGDLSNLHTAL